MVVSTWSKSKIASLPDPHIDWKPVVSDIGTNRCTSTIVAYQYPGLGIVTTEFSGRRRAARRSYGLKVNRTSQIAAGLLSFAITDC